SKEATTSPLLQIGFERWQGFTIPGFRVRASGSVVVPRDARNVEAWSRLRSADQLTVGFESKSRSFAASYRGETETPFPHCCALRRSIRRRFPLTPGGRGCGSIHADSG